MMRYYSINADALAQKRYLRNTEELTESELDEYAEWLASEVVARIAAGARYVRMVTASDALVHKIHLAVKRRLCGVKKPNIEYDCQSAWYDRGDEEDYIAYQCEATSRCEIAPLAHHLFRMRDLDIGDVLSYLKIIDGVAVVAASANVAAMLLRVVYYSEEEARREPAEAI